MKNLFIIFTLLFFCITRAQDITVSGTVFVDANQNGVMEASEKKLKNVMVSNGRDLVKTDKKGRYTLQAEKGASLFPVLPAGYAYSNEDQWWFLADPDKTLNKNIQGVNFGLVSSPSKKNFKALIIGDIQVEDEAELGYADRSLLAELRNRKDYDFSIFLGDLVNDEPRMFPMVKDLVSDLEKPNWFVYGNHDRNSAREHRYQHLDYNSSFGPSTYAFYRGKVLFVVMNTIEPVGKYGYDGNYSTSDLEFLKNLLERTGNENLLVVSQHIPLGWMKNKQALLDLLQDQKEVLLLSGHSHTVFQTFRKTGAGHIHELTAGAVSGHWWTGEKDWQGIPLALMQCGTPRGYFEIDFTHKKGETNYQVRYKGVGLAADRQLSIWFGEPGKEISRTLTKDDPKVLLNVFAGSEKTEVKLRVNQGDWQLMTRERSIDPFIYRIKELQDEKLYPDQVSRRSPYLDRPSSHLWAGKVPTDLEEGLNELEVWAKDEHGLDHRESVWFWFDGSTEHH